MRRSSNGLQKIKDNSAVETVATDKKKSYQFRLRRNEIEETARAVSLQLIAVGTRHCRLLRLLRLLRLYHSDANGFDITRRLKPLLHTQSPPSRTKNGK